MSFPRMPVVMLSMLGMLMLAPNCSAMNAFLESRLGVATGVDMDKPVASAHIPVSMAAGIYVLPVLALTAKAEKDVYAGSKTSSDAYSSTASLSVGLRMSPLEGNSHLIRPFFGIALSREWTQEAQSSYVYDPVIGEYVTRERKVPIRYNRLIAELGAELRFSQRMGMGVGIAVGHTPYAFHDPAFQWFGTTREYLSYGFAQFTWHLMGRTAK